MILSKHSLIPLLCVIMPYNALAQGWACQDRLARADNARQGLLSDNRAILDKATACDNALRAAQDLIQAQNNSIVGLKDAKAQLADQLAKEVLDRPLFPWYVYTIAGAVAGGLLIKAIGR